MGESEKLENAIEKLRKSVNSFRLGAISLDDYKPYEDKIKIMYNTLTQLNARILMLKAHHHFLESEDVVEKDAPTKCHEATSNCLLNNLATKSCLHSYTITNILSGRQGDPDKQKKMYDYMRKIYSINDELMILQKEIDEAMEKQLNLKIECQNMLYDHKKFLEVQEEMWNKKLQETNPEIARNKRKLIQRLDKVNIMKKLIVNFIAASNHLLMEKPILIEMLEKHRDLIDIDTIMKMARSSTENETETMVQTKSN
ncbi:uncharacterized protein LOC117229535 isoform X2 [Megalopta genalis]|uniref:uncharacterized protein LOC117229535 isoform X2 n=1 Tax=Megalopta genalis TaxID=115081 RepID=UPI0014435DE7|nr:uncharacterized protein LOC117229535 isoform X2 [Megalopta genalis]